MTTPSALVRLVDDWVADGSPGQDSIGWNSQRWLAGTDKYPRAMGYAKVAKEVVGALPAKVARDDVAMFGAVAAEGPDDLPLRSDVPDSARRRSVAKRQALRPQLPGGLRSCRPVPLGRDWATSWARTWCRPVGGQASGAVGAC